MGDRQRVLFDALAAGDGRSGAGRRIKELAPRLAAMPGFDVAVMHRAGAGAAFLAALGGARRVPVETRGGGALRRALFQEAWYRQVPFEERGGLVVADCLPLPRSVALAVTVHDLRHLESGPLRRGAAALVLARGLRRAAGVAAVSEATARGLRERWPELAPRVRVVPNGVDCERFRPEAAAEDAEVLRQHDLVPPYVLVVGHLEPRKDPDVAFEVHRRLVARGRDVGLVLVGTGPLWRTAARRAAEAVAAGRRVRLLTDVGDEDLPAIYRGAAALLAPSRLEGFGMAPLEALASGTPVVASRIPAHEEVLGDAALSAEAGDAGAFADAIDGIVRGGGAVEARRARGLDRAARLSWDAAASALAAALRAWAGGAAQTAVSV